MVAPIVITPAAFSVKLAAPPLDFEIAANTEISPACVIAAAAVLMITLVPALRSVLIREARTCEGCPLLAVLLGVHVPPVKLPREFPPGLVTAVTISTSRGSSNHFPALPFAAPALIRIPSTSKNSLPEVSTKPPLPDTAPPLAEMVPYARVVLLDQRMTLPPLPVERASAQI